MTAGGKGGAAGERERAALLDLIARIPVGRVATHGQISVQLRMMRPHVVQAMLALAGSLDESGQAIVPWHRVVADGGAIGRHKFRDVQMARLRAEGLSVAPAGIIDELQRRRIGSFDAPGEAIDPPAPSSTGSRSRGMKSHR